MKTDFNIGDKVETIDDNVKGKVISVAEEEIVLMTNEGFEMPFKPNELIKSPSEKLSVNFNDLYEAKQQKTRERPPKSKALKKSRSFHSMEVDLHIHELIDDARRLSNYEILNIQMEHAKKRLEWAMQKRLKSVIFIHGVGEGVLKAELQTLFRRYDNLEFFDANYQTYGVGATEVRIY